MLRVTPQGNMDRTPDSRLQDIRKRIRTGRHKYAVPGIDSTTSSTCSTDGDASLDDSSVAASAELVEILRMRDACSLVHKQSGMSTTPAESPIVEPPMLPLSPPRTPGRDHDNASFPTDFPKVLPLGPPFDDAKSRAASGDEQSDRQQQASSPSLDSCPPPTFRLKPTFTADFLQNVSEQQKEHKENNKVPELPFHFAAVVHNRQGSKVAAKMSQARLPLVNELSESATAA